MILSEDEWRQMVRGRERMGGEKSDGGLFTLEAIFKCLTDPQRRYILYYLQEHETATVDELARQIAAWETEQSPGDVSSEQRERIATALHHQHLPTLADALFIDYDQRSESIRYTEPPVLLEAFLRLAAEIEIDDEPGE